MLHVFQCSLPERCNYVICKTQNLPEDQMRDGSIYNRCVVVNFVISGGSWLNLLVGLQVIF